MRGSPVVLFAWIYKIYLLRSVVKINDQHHSHNMLDIIIQHQDILKANDNDNENPRNMGEVVVNKV